MKDIKYQIKCKKDALLHGILKSKITKIESDKYCYFCKDKNGSIKHLLLNCGVSKKDQIRRHDKVGELIYKSRLKKFHINKGQISNNQQDKEVGNHETTVIWNKNISTTLGIPKRPDIFLQQISFEKKSNSKKGWIIDVTILAIKTFIWHLFIRLTNTFHFKEI